MSATDRKATETQILAALRALENDVRELMHMSDIAAEAFDDIFGQGNQLEPQPGQAGQTYRVTDQESDRMAFLINNVAERCSLLEKSFYAALNAEKRT